MKKIALFGATGQTGNWVLKKLLAQGYSVQVLVRQPARLTDRHPALAVIEGDVLHAADVRKTVAGCEAVISVFGHVKGSPPGLQTTGTRHILEAMRAAGCRRIISLSGGGLPFERDEPKFVDHLIRTIMKVAVPKILQDAVAHAEVLKSSDTDWVIVRGPRLTQGPPRGTYRIGWVGVNASTQIARADLAEFIVSQIDDNRFLRQMPFISY